jgi:hypothetical protein
MNLDNTFTALETFVSYFKKNGYDKTMAALTIEDGKVTSFDDPYINLVLNSVSEAFGMEVESLLYAKYARGDNKFAVGFCVYYLYKNMSIRDISDTIFISRHKTNISKYKILIESLNPKYKSDIPYLKIKDKLDKILINK